MSNTAENAQAGRSKQKLVARSICFRSQTTSANFAKFIYAFNSIFVCLSLITSSHYNLFDLCNYNCDYMLYAGIFDNPNSTVTKRGESKQNQ